MEFSRTAQGGSDEFDQKLEVPLANLKKLIEGNSKLTHELEKQGRADLTASMERNRYGASVGMIPPFVAPYLAGSRESKLPRGILKFARSCARHERFQ
jgi:hypothetical protein